MNKNKLKAYGNCTTCKKTNLKVRLYRPYGNFYRSKDNFCNVHVPERGRDCYIPLIFNQDGEVWGYLNTPQKDLDTFYALPESDNKGLCWIPTAMPAITNWRTIKEWECLFGNGVFLENFDDQQSAIQYAFKFNKNNQPESLDVIVRKRNK